MTGFLDTQRTHEPNLPGFDDDVVTRLLLSGCFFLIILTIILLPAYFSDLRLVEGSPVWLKPIKFGVSLGIHFFTLAVLAQLLTRPVRTGPTLTITSYLAIFALMLETIYIIIQAARGRRSHFNFETQWEALMYAAMGIGALLLVLVAIALGIQIWRKAKTSPGLKTGAVLGLILGAIGTIILAGYMSSSGSRWVGTPTPGGPAVPVFGWSLEVGDFRPSHFVTMHMMQTLPLLGWICDRVRLPGVLIVWVATLVHLALAGYLFWLALQGKPFWPV